MTTEITRTEAANLAAEALADAVNSGDLAPNAAAHLVTEVAGKLAGADDAQEIIDAAVATLHSFT